MFLIKGVTKIIELIYNEAEKEWLDEGRFMEALNMLHESFENGDITEEEYEEGEEEVLSQLRVIRKYKRDHEVGE